MGLDTSHDCWHGAYSAFMRWRERLAEVAGYPPLRAMEGFFRPDEWWLMTTNTDAGGPTMFRFPALAKENDSRLSYEAMTVFRALPIQWTHFEADPLSKLLRHSDCDGSIASADCGPIADRLIELLPLLDGEGGGHVGNYRAKTQAFIDGLRRAAAALEDVDFH